MFSGLSNHAFERSRGGGELGMDAFQQGGQDTLAQALGRVDAAFDRIYSDKTK